MLKEYQEPLTQAVSIEAHPKDYSVDNGVLFTCVAYQLGLMDLVTLEQICFQYFDPERGCLLRYPHDSNYMSWDDHLALVASSDRAMELIRSFLVKSGFYLPDKNWLGRFVVLDALILNVFAPLAAFSYLIDPLTSKEETSGRQLLWLASRWFEKHLPLMKPVLWFWRWQMMKKYPNGLKDLFAIYYQDPKHPFHEAAPTNFE